jgi:signal recognition particle receptor subunit beta
MGSRRSIEYSSILEMLLCEHTGKSRFPLSNSPNLISSHHVHANKQAIIYVIDSSDASRLPTSRSELLTMLSEDELKSVPVLVFANKQDVEGALSPGDISDKLGLAGQEKGREWSVRGSCATKGEGLEEGLDW